MTVIGVVVGLVLAAAPDGRFRRAVPIAGAAAALPPAGLLAGLVIAMRWAHRRLSRRPSHPDDEAVVAEVIALGLSAGLTFPNAASIAAAAAPGPVSSHLTRSIRMHSGASAGPGGSSGLFIVARRALSTGAPLVAAVSDYAAARRRDEQSRQVSAARRLPVKLLFPLSLLILPGFLVLTVAPAFLGGLDRLGL